MPQVAHRPSSATFCHCLSTLYKLSTIRFCRAVRSWNGCYRYAVALAASEIEDVRKPPQEQHGNSEQKIEGIDARIVEQKARRKVLA